MPRPTKLTKQIITAFRTILDKELNVLMCTDWDLCFLLNKQLKPSQRISYRTFQRYKRDAMIGGYMNDDEDHAEWDEFDPLYHEMFELFAEALINMKQSLMTKMMDDDKHWRRYQWILERKFMEWNLNWSSREVAREQKYMDADEVEAQVAADEEFRQRTEYKIRRELEREYAKRNGNYRDVQQPITEEEYAEIENRHDKKEEPLNIIPPPADAAPEASQEPPAEPEKPLPYWKRPGYEPDPNRFRHLR